MLTFFKQRRLDLDRDGPWEPSDKGIRWEELYAELFWACEDLELDQDVDLEAHGWIDELTFRARIKAILPRFETFEQPLR